MSVEIPPEVEETDEWLFNKIADKVKATFNVPISDEQIRTAIHLPLSESDIMLMYYHQDEYCVKCGNCCRVAAPISCEKEHFRKIAKSLNLSYKKLKKRVGARTVNGVVKMLGAPCHFLEGKNHCSIYELRPLVCIMYPMGKSILTVVQSNRIFLVKDCPAQISLIENVMETKILVELMKEAGVKIPSVYSEEEIKYIQSLDTVGRMRYFGQQMKNMKRRLRVRS